MNQLNHNFNILSQLWHIQTQHCFHPKGHCLKWWIGTKKIWLSCLGFLFYIFWIKMPNLLWKFSLFLSNSVGYILCPPSSPRFPQSLAFTCTVCILWGSSSLLLTNTENSVNIKAFYFKSCSPFWWWCWIFKHLPVWQLCNFLVPTFTTYFLVLFQYFRQTFPFVFLRGHCLLNWLDFVLFWCHLFWWVMCLNDLLRKTIWKIRLKTTAIAKCLFWYYYRSVSFMKHD